LIWTSPCNPYLASVPIAPNAPISNKRNVSPIRLLSPHRRKKLLVPPGSQESSAPAHQAWAVMANSIAVKLKRVYRAA
jgi:hypothetical protein